MRSHVDQRSTRLTPNEKKENRVRFKWTFIYKNRVYGTFDSSNRFFFVVCSLYER